MYRKEKKIILLSLITFLIWGLISSYWYTCNIRGFCHGGKNNNIEQNTFVNNYSNNQEMEQVAYTGNNNQYNETDEDIIQIETENYSNNLKKEQNPYANFNRFEKQKVRKIVTRNFVISGKNRNSIIWNVDGKRGKYIKCLTYLNTKIKPHSRNNLPEEVKKLEMFLNDFYKAGVPVNGIYEDIDISFVELFQNEYKLKPDGIVGNKTVNYINALECLKENGYYKK